MSNDLERLAKLAAARIGENSSLEEIEKAVGISKTVADTAKAATKSLECTSAIKLRMDQNTTIVGCTNYICVNRSCDCMDTKAAIGSCSTARRRQAVARIFGERERICKRIIKPNNIRPDLCSSVKIIFEFFCLQKLSS